MFKCILPILLTVIAVMSVQLGLDWIELGYGLHPAIAFSSAVILVFTSFKLIDSMYMKIYDVEA